MGRGQKKIKIIVDKMEQVSIMGSIGYGVNQKNPRLASQLAWYRSNRVFIDLDHILSKGLGHKLTQVRHRSNWMFNNMSTNVRP